jgi:hypothetical protein
VGWASLASALPARPARERSNTRKAIVREIDGNSVAGALMRSVVGHRSVEECVE